MCRHCHRRFIAEDSAAPSLMIDCPNNLERAESLLRLIELLERENALPVRENQGSASGGRPA
jgi:hypothetical protein